MTASLLPGLVKEKSLLAKEDNNLLSFLKSIFNNLMIPRILRFFRGRGVLGGCLSELGTGDW